MKVVAVVAMTALTIGLVSLAVIGFWLCPNPITNLPSPTEREKIGAVLIGFACPLLAMEVIGFLLLWAAKKS